MTGQYHWMKWRHPYHRRSLTILRYSATQPPVATGIAPELFNLCEQWRLAPVVWLYALNVSPHRLCEEQRSVAIQGPGTQAFPWDSGLPRFARSDTAGDVIQYEQKTVQSVACRIRLSSIHSGMLAHNRIFRLRIIPAFREYILPATEQAHENPDFFLGAETGVRSSLHLPGCFLPLFGLQSLLQLVKLCLQCGFFAIKRIQTLQGAPYPLSNICAVRFGHAYSLSLVKR